MKKHLKKAMMIAALTSMVSMSAFANAPAAKQHISWYERVCNAVCAAGAMCGYIV